MNEPYLVFIGETGGIPTKGRCSACGDVLFVTGADAGVAQEHISSLEKQFRDHVRKVHMRDTSQSSVRIMKNAQK
jgi:hypothetical protein